MSVNSGKKYVKKYGCLNIHAHVPTHRFLLSFFPSFFLYVYMCVRACMYVCMYVCIRTCSFYIHA